MPTRKLGPRPIPRRRAVPFTDAEEAWFWFVQCQARRTEGARLDNLTDRERPCEPDDIYRAVMGLRLRGRLEASHLRVLARYGRAGRPPDSRAREEEWAARMWDEAVDALTTPLKTKGIVG